MDNSTSQFFVVWWCVIFNSRASNEPRAQPSRCWLERVWFGWSGDVCLPIFGKVEPRQEGGEVFVRYDGHQDGPVRNDVQQRARYIHLHVQLVRVQLIAAMRMGETVCSVVVVREDDAVLMMILALIKFD